MMLQFQFNDRVALSSCNRPAFRAFLDEIILIGYVRISTDDQLLDLQRDAMAKAGCERVFEDTAAAPRPIESAWPRFSPI
ncbi:hypothetical protein CDO41_34030 [Pseudomonas aeruginosa]|nr:hypothetical protein CDO41_34030 [Pseudomonas aeruginosa]